MTVTWHYMVVSNTLSRDGIRHRIRESVCVKVRARCQHTFAMGSIFQPLHNTLTSSRSVKALQNSPSREAVALGTRNSRLSALRYLTYGTDTLIRCTFTGRSPFGPSGTNSDKIGLSLQERLFSTAIFRFPPIYTMLKKISFPCPCSYYVVEYNPN